jgi:hypothetical protein
MLQKQIQIRSLTSACASPTKEEHEKKGRVRNAGEGVTGLSGSSPETDWRFRSKP